MTAHSQEVENHFDRYADDWRNLYIKPRSANDIALRNRMEISVRLLQKYLPNGGTILDAGCGAGLLSDRLAMLGFTVHGADISQSMIDMCVEHFNKNFPGGHPHLFSVGDLSQLKLENNSFDAVAALGFLEYIEDEASALRIFYSLLKPNGVLIITGPLKKSIALVLSTWVSKLTKKPSPRPSISIQLYSVSRFKELLKPVGFEIYEFHRHGFASFPIIGGGRKGILLHKFLPAISHILPIKSFCNDIVVAAYKPGGGS
jgi:2-polyprenyl-3-methyl-5-hydroxy-6-metoxy-1,4-benzoquinol methylase